MDKQWVFEQIVEDYDKDIVGLFAYALYKREKSELASAGRKKGKSETVLKTELNQFHDSVADSSRRQKDYKREAHRVLNEVTRQVESELKAEYEKKLKIETSKLDKEIRRLQVELKKAPKKAEIALIRRVSSTPVSTSFWKRFWSWTLSGLSGIWAATLIMVVVYLLAITTTSSENRNELLKDLALEIVLKLSESPIPELSFDDTQESVIQKSKS